MNKNKKEMLNSILEKYKELFVILREIDDVRAYYPMKIIKEDMIYIEKFLSSENNDNEINQLLSILKKNYYSMYTPKWGFQEVFIWKENFEDRRKANLKLDKIKAEIIEVFNNV